MAHPQLNTVILDYVGDPTEGPKIIDIPKGLSIVNRKSYRSGYIYSVDFIEYIPDVGAPGAQNEVTIAHLPNSYPILNAYQLGFENWKEQRAEAIGETGIQPGRWSDFKPFYNEDHQNGTFGELEVRGIGTGFALQELDRTGGEWNRAELIRNDVGAATTTTINVGMLGDDNLAAAYGSLIEAYGDTRVATLSPDPLLPVVASQSWITRTGEASAAMTLEVVDLIEDENERPPYANQNDVTLPPTYVGNSESHVPLGMLMDRAVTGSTGRAVNLDGGLVPLGLLAINVAGTELYTIRVHVTRGDYKGVAAKVMGDFD